MPASLIASWKHRRRIVPVGYVKGTGRDVPLYLLSELQELVGEWRARRDTRGSQTK